MGKLIVFEGIDGSGKSTQFKMLCDRLAGEEISFRRLTFPQYSEESSALIRMYLGGQFGSHPDDVNAYAASTFYAVDRFASFARDWRSDYQKGGLFLADRYTTSNAIHQGSKLPDGEREKYFGWLYEFEFGLMQLPKPDKVIYMDVPVEFALAQMEKRQRDTNTKGDIHETDVEYLKRCAVCGAKAAEYLGWSKIRCVENGAMRPVSDIHDEIYSIIEKEI